MPTYGYKCRECAHTFEVFQKISDPAITACEKCGAAVKKIVYPVGIQFKGSGFYINDYARSGAPREAKEGAAAGETKGDTKSESSAPAKGSEPKSETASETKADTKSETKTETKKEAPAAASSS